MGAFLAPFEYGDKLSRFMSTDLPKLSHMFDVLLAGLDAGALTLLVLNSVLTFA